MNKSKTTCKPPLEWLRLLDNGTLDAWFKQTYSEGANLDNKKSMLRSLLTEFHVQFGDERCLISRAPGRLNIMGRHVDHQGGHGNMIALDRDVYVAVAAAPGERRVRVRNVNKELYPPEDFIIDELLNGPVTNWNKFIDSQFVRSYNQKHQKKWSIYFKSIIARMQVEFPHIQFAGMDICAVGDVPIAAGLSSSSTLVVALMESLVALNDIPITDQKFVEMCGEGEWFVGTRGGAGDHAAMKFARKDKVVQIGFFPMEQTTAVDFPADYSMVICNSRINAKKTSNAREKFNQRVACYHFGKAIMQDALGPATRLQHLRDFLPANGNISSWVLKDLLLQLPINASRESLKLLVSEDMYRNITIRFGANSDLYPIRDVVIYGLAECQRSKDAPHLLRQNDIATFGRWMNISHDGDRVLFSGTNKPEYSDDYVTALFGDKTNLAEVPGAYGCSLKTIDKMVDSALASPGVLGAQISGAGLGGCIMVLVKNENTNDLHNNMVVNYYRPNDLEPDIITSRPGSGSGLVHTNGAQ